MKVRSLAAALAMLCAMLCASSCSGPFQESVPTIGCASSKGYSALRFSLVGLPTSSSSAEAVYDFSIRAYGKNENGDEVELGSKTYFLLRADQWLLDQQLMVPEETTKLRAELYDAAHNSLLYISLRSFDATVEYCEFAYWLDVQKWNTESKEEYGLSSTLAEAATNGVGQDFETAPYFLYEVPAPKGRSYKIRVNQLIGTASTFIGPALDGISASEAAMNEWTVLPSYASERLYILILPKAYGVACSTTLEFEDTSLAVVQAAPLSFAYDRAVLGGDGALYFDLTGAERLRRWKEGEAAPVEMETYPNRISALAPSADGAYVASDERFYAVKGDGTATLLLTASYAIKGVVDSGSHLLLMEKKPSSYDGELNLITVAKQDYVIKDSSCWVWGVGSTKMTFFDPATSRVYFYTQGMYKMLYSWKIGTDGRISASAVERPDATGEIIGFLGNPTRVVMPTRSYLVEGSVYSGLSIFPVTVSHATSIGDTVYAISPGTSGSSLVRRSTLFPSTTLKTLAAIGAIDEEPEIFVRDTGLVILVKRNGLLEVNRYSAADLATLAAAPSASYKGFGPTHHTWERFTP